MGGAIMYDPYKYTYVTTQLRWWEKKRTWQIIECVFIAVVGFASGWLFAEILRLIKITG